MIIKGWIDVTEELPKGSLEVLVWNGSSRCEHCKGGYLKEVVGNVYRMAHDSHPGKVITGKYSSRLKKWIVPIKDYKVTYWMKIPDTPSEFYIPGVGDVSTQSISFSFKD